MLPNNLIEIVKRNTTKAAVGVQKFDVVVSADDGRTRHVIIEARNTVVNKWKEVDTKQIGRVRTNNAHTAVEASYQIQTRCIVTLITIKIRLETFAFSNELRTSKLSWEPFPRQWHGVVFYVQKLMGPYIMLRDERSTDCDMNIILL